MNSMTVQGSKIHGVGLDAEIQAVVTESSAHVHALVGGQRVVHIPAHRRKKVQNRQNARNRSAFGSTTRSRQQPQNNITVDHDDRANFDEPKMYYCDDESSSEHEEAGIYSTSEYEFHGEQIKSPVPKDLQNKLRKLMQNFPDGILLTELFREYKRMFKEPLLYQKYHYRSLIDMCCNLTDIFVCQVQDSSDYLLYSKKVGDLKKPNDTEETSKLTDVVHLDDIIPHYFPYPDHKVGDYIDVTIGEIYNPDKFYSCLSFAGLEEMMEELQIFFEEQCNKYTLPEKAKLQENLYTVTCHCQKYYRTVVVKVADPCVRVLFIDYGSLATVSMDMVFQMPLRFSHLPSQAFCTKLYNLLPAEKNSDWSLGTVKRFREFCGFDRSLVVEIKGIDNNVVYVELIDATDESEVFFISKVLVKEGLARYEDERLCSDMQNLSLASH